MKHLQIIRNLHRGKFNFVMKIGLWLDELIIVKEFKFILIEEQNLQHIVLSFIGLVPQSRSGRRFKINSLHSVVFLRKTLYGSSVWWSYKQF